MHFFEETYSGVPPWDIGRPQQEIVRLEVAGQIKGRVLDVGCGTGEHVLYLASQGYEAWGIDFAPTAITKAEEKAKERGIIAKFTVANALELQMADERFDTVIDIGLFHVFADEERLAFSDSLSSVMNQNGTYFMLCFSDREPPGWGPRRVSQDEIRATFTEGWHINYIKEAEFETNFNLVRAWLSSISKVNN